MAKAANRRLKVFEAQFGFHDTVLAAPSQAEALRVWGTRQNLFAEGLAKPSHDDAAIQAALAQPGVLLRRAVGSSDAFRSVPDSLPRASAQRKTAQAKPPSRARLTAAEAALRRLDEKHRDEAADLQRRREKLETDAAEAAQRQDVARKAATTNLEAAKAAYRKAGGRD